MKQLITISQDFIERYNQPYKRYFFYQTPAFKHRLSVLIGQRGVGKTTAVVQKLLEHTQGNRFDTRILYVQVDHFKVGTMSLYEIAEKFVELGGEVIAFDEIHKYSNWSQELKSLYDTFPELVIYASGSSALEIYKGSHDLSRRAITLDIDGCSFREYCEMRYGMQIAPLSLSDIIEKHNEIASNLVQDFRAKQLSCLRVFAEYCQLGYYPYSHELTEPSLFFMTLEKHCHVTIETDLPAIHQNITGVSIRKIKKLLVYLATSVPFTPNWSKMRAILQISDERTVKNYFYYLEQSGLIRLIGKGGLKLSQLEADDKVYLDNTNLIYAISSEAADSGTVRETFFASALSSKHQLNTIKKGDFLVDEELVFEVGGKNKDFNQLKLLKKQFPCYLACDDIEVGFAEKIPLWLFGLLY